MTYRSDDTDEVFPRFAAAVFASTSFIPDSVIDAAYADLAEARKADAARIAELEGALDAANETCQDLQDAHDDLSRELAAAKTSEPSLPPVGSTVYWADGTGWVVHSHWGNVASTVTGAPVRGFNCDQIHRPSGAYRVAFRLDEEGATWFREKPEGK